MKRIFTAISICLLVALLATGCNNTKQPQEATQPTAPAEKQDSKKPAQPPAPTGAKKYENAPAMQISTSKQYTAVIHTSMGDITIQLFAKDAPKAVNNFVFLAKEKFYENLTFHRVDKNFMIQTGDPLGNGTGGPGYTFEDELNNGHKYEPGVVAMANAGANTNGSQFFIGSGKGVTGLEHSPDYTIFGKVTKGMDIVQKIASVKVKANPVTKEVSMPENPITIKSISIEEK